MAEVEVKPCSNPGCDQLGSKSCSACKTTVYCCVGCQTADWAHHKEECPGHLRKVGMTNLAKAQGFLQERNWAQTLRYADLAATKLKQLKDRRLETVQAINDALYNKYDALQFMSRVREAMECIKECYTLWAMNHMRNPGSIRAALGLIHCCLQNEEYEDAEHYARHAMFMINDMADNFIPADQRPLFLAGGSYYLARAVFRLSEAGGIPLEEKQKAGEEAIALARQALEIHTRLHGVQSSDVAADMTVLAEALDYFNDVDDDEILRLHEQANAITKRVEGILSVNVAIGESILGHAYIKRARRANSSNDLDRALSNLELALPHYRESARIFRANNHVDSADTALRHVAHTEDLMRQTELVKAEQRQR